VLFRSVVNGKSAPIYRVNGGLRGIVLERGSDRIVMEYRPWPLYLAWLLALGALCGPFLLRSRWFRPPNPAA
jgi:uncharacterized membrane protein YfhO